MIHVGDCLEVMRTMDANSVDAIVTDPPYGLGFMGKAWDHGVPGEPFWREALRVAKPGAHIVAFGGTRTFHRLVCAIEDAGWEIRDTLMWVYGSGFPKSLDVSKAIDKHGGQCVAWFGPWLRAWREENGISQKTVAALFPSKTGGLTGCVANWELGLNMPTPEQFNTMREALNLPFASLEVLAREVFGQQAATKLEFAPGEGRDRIGIVRDLTAPASEGARQWQGWGTALKPAWEPIILARKPLAGTVAANVQQHGTGALNIDGCRIQTEDKLGGGGQNPAPMNKPEGWHRPWMDDADAKAAHAARVDANVAKAEALGRWPANVIHDGSDEVVALLPQSDGRMGAVRGTEASKTGDGACYGEYGRVPFEARGDSGSAARFFYCAKTSADDRHDGLDSPGQQFSKGSTPRAAEKVEAAKRGNHHPTVKPTELMRWLCRLVTPPGGLILDPFCGSGSTGRGAIAEGFRFVGIELDPEYAAIAEARTRVVQPGLPFGAAA